jgi:hypothetical protein
VYVVGAGASKEANLPLGSELKASIANSLEISFRHGYEQTSGDRLIVEALRLVDRDINPYLHAGRHIAAAMPQSLSIDNFIDAHAGDKRIEVCGKLAIARAILAAEERSLLSVHSGDPRESFSFVGRLKKAGSTSSFSS